MEPQPLKLRCTGGGSETPAPCDCGKPLNSFDPPRLQRSPSRHTRANPIERLPQKSV